MSHGAGRKPQLAPLPVVKGGTSPAMSMLSQRSGNMPTSTAGTALISRDTLPDKYLHFHQFNLSVLSAVVEWLQVKVQKKAMLS